MVKTNKSSNNVVTGNTYYYRKVVKYPLMVHNGLLLTYISLIGLVHNFITVPVGVNSFTAHPCFFPERLCTMYLYVYIFYNCF